MVEEETKKNAEVGNEPSYFIVFGDGLWRKCGFSSLFSVATLIGKFSHKIINVAVKLVYCQNCKNREHCKGTPENKE